VVRLLDIPLGFAHRGGCADAPENTIEAFKNALDEGVNGLESDVWLTADGVAVLHHDPKVRIGWRRRPIWATNRSDLPTAIPSLADLFGSCGSSYQLSLDLKDTNVVDSVVETAAAFDPSGLSRLWLCHPATTVLAAWRELHPEVRLVNSTGLQRMPDGPHHHAVLLAESGIDAVNLRSNEWTGDLVEAFHRAGRLTFAWDAQTPRAIESLLRMGLDGIYSDHPALLTGMADRL
jgi:glycerophosphoryl diester phosphodiesterase